MPRPERHVFVCIQNRPETHPKGCCTARGGGEVIQEFAKQIDERCLRGRLALTSTGCIGPCELGPNVLVYPEGVMYSGVQKEDVGAIIDEHLLGGKPVERLLTPAELWS